MERLTRCAAVVVLLLATATAQAAGGFASRPQLAVLDFETRNADPLLAASVSEAATGALRELRVFKVVSHAEVRQMLALERERALLAAGCEDSSCISSIGNAIGARYVIVGQLIALEKGKGPLSLRVRLFDMRRTEVRSDETRRDLAGPKEALEAAPALVRAAVRPVLDKEQGFLDLSCRENGANVTIDGRLVGVTPFAMQRLGWGPHRVVVEKEGFIAWGRDVQIERNQTTTEVVALVPSPEFIEAYRSKHRGLRAGAWITTALALAGAGAALGIQYGVVEPTFDRFNPLQKGFAGDPRVDLEAECEKAGRPLGADNACYEHARSLGRKGENWQWGARAASGAAVLATGLATYFWIAGEDPGRYDAYRSLGPAPVEPPITAAVVPTQGGAMASVQLRF